MTGPHDTEEHPAGEEPWYGTGYDDGPATAGEPAAEYPEGPTDPPTRPGLPHPSTAPPGEPATVRAETPGPPRTGWWRSRRVRVGAAATLAGLVLLGGGFGAGYAVADASAPSAAAHATAAPGAGKGAAAGQAARKRRADRRRQQQDGGTTPGTGAAPDATADAPTS